MSDIIKSAIDGQRNALTKLYSANKDRAFYIASLLQIDEKKASLAVGNAFANALSFPEGVNIENEQEFDSFALRCLGEELRRIESEGDKNAFKLPDNKNFLVLEKVECGSDSETADRVFDKLPMLQKTIFVLLAVGNLGKKDIASACGLDIKTADIAIDAVKGNILRITDNSLDFDKMAKAFREREKGVACSKEADEIAKKAIIKLSAHNEKARKKKLTMTIAGIVAICIIVCSLAALGIFKYSGKFNENAVYRAKIHVKDYGTIVLELDAKEAPITVENFFNLVKSDFYDGTTFHRIEPNFIIQGGSPDGTSWGASEKAIVGEFAENGIVNNISHVRGTISMARPDDYNGASCQFFILQEDRTKFDGLYAGFGHVVKGMEIVDKICEDAEANGTTGVLEKRNQPIIKKITISRIK